MKSYNDLLKFYGVDCNCSYVVTKVKNQKYKDLIGKRFIIKPWYKDSGKDNIDEFGILFLGKNLLHCSVLNDLKYENANILDAIEKRYLKNIIKPFKNRVLHIVKTSVDFSGRIAFITIGLKPSEINGVGSSGEQIYLPYFKSETMYKGMDLNKRYTLAELGLL